MCVAIAQLSGARTLTSKEIDNGWEVNPDGGGFSYINENSGITTYKSMELNQFKEKYLEAHASFGESSPFIVHMRIATHGDVAIETTHPFIVDSNKGTTVLAHNGIISDMNEFTDSKTSDTMALVSRVINNLPDNWLDSDGLSEMVSSYIGHSKLVVLTTSEDCKQELYVINPKLGSWDDNIWFSNSSCKDMPVTHYGSAYAGWNNELFGEDWTPINSQVKKPFEYIDYEGVPTGSVLYDATELTGATAAELYDITAACVELDVYCVICTGIQECFCDVLCYACYEVYYDCECEGLFVSLEGKYTHKSTRLAATSDNAKFGDWLAND